MNRHTQARYFSSSEGGKLSWWLFSTGIGLDEEGRVGQAKEALLQVELMKERKTCLKAGGMGGLIDERCGVEPEGAMSVPLPC